jgi:Ca2+-binding RTX toxin-like protein
VFDTKLGKTNASNKKTNLDTITDFTKNVDQIWLNDSIFKAKELKSFLKNKKASIDKPVKIKSDFFKSFDSKKIALKDAQDSNDYVLYDKRSGKLYYDADGAGGKDAIQIATLTKHPTLTYKDIFMI